MDGWMDGAGAGGWGERQGVGLAEEAGQERVGSAWGIERPSSDAGLAWRVEQPLGWPGCRLRLPGLLTALSVRPPPPASCRERQDPVRRRPPQGAARAHNSCAAEPGTGGCAAQPGAVPGPPAAPF